MHSAVLVEKWKSGEKFFAAKFRCNAAGEFISRGRVQPNPRRETCVRVGESGDGGCENENGTRERLETSRCPREKALPGRYCSLYPEHRLCRAFRAPGSPL